jgi:hypothetical protein
MKFPFSALCFLLAFSHASAQDPLDPNLFQAGVYGDHDRTVTCISGQSGATFEQVGWAWIPDDLGAAYITLRFEFPANLDFSAHPIFHDLVVDVLVRDYPGSTVEWRMLFEGCPSGWIKVFSQQCILLDDQPSEIRIFGENSMVRDCDFILNDLSVLNNLSLNDPDCQTVSVEVSTWGWIKSIFRD